MRRTHFKTMEEKASFIRKRKKLLGIFCMLCILCNKDTLIKKKPDNPAHLLIDLYPTREKGLNGEIAC